MDNQYLEKLFEKFQIKPNNYSIYLEAFTHSSYKNDNHLDYSYERLEFLGDAIIQKIVTEHLYKKHLEMNEGDMSKARNIIVQSGTLVRAAKELLFENIILVGNSLSKNDNKITDNILEDSFEAFIGAVFLDQNEKKCYQILKRTIIHYFEINALNEFKDWKSLFQELMQKNGKTDIRYATTKYENKEYTVELWNNNTKYSIAKDENIKRAQIKAAKEAYNKCIRIK